MHPRDWVAERTEEALCVDGYDLAILGIAHIFGRDPVVAYDMDKMVELLIEEGMEEEEAREYLDFNVLGAWMGTGTPVFVELR